MTRAGLVGIALVIALAGCATTSEGRWIGSAAPSESTAPSESVGPSQSAGPRGLADAADGGDVAACYDGTCEIAVTGTVVVPFDPQFRVPSLRVTFTPPARVDLLNGDPGIYMRSTVTGGTGYMQMNGIRALVTVFPDEGAVLTITPVR